MSIPIDPATVNVLAIGILSLAALFNAQDRLFPEPYHTSSLTGPAYTAEILEASHSERLPTVLGISRHVFYKLLEMLIMHAGFSDSRDVLVEEKLAIFLWLGRYNSSFREIGERFQRTNDTVHRHVFYLLIYILNQLITIFTVSSTRCLFVCFTPSSSLATSRLLHQIHLFQPIL